MVEQARPFASAQTIMTADAGYHSEQNLQELDDKSIPALIADAQMRKRDERFKDQGKYKALPDPLYNKGARATKVSHGKFKPNDFSYDPDANACICPAGKDLYSNGSQCTTGGRMCHRFTGAKRDCVPCKLRENACAPLVRLR